MVSKTVETTGEGATKKVVETDYSDAIVIFAMTIGGACVLAGALYGRLRDITLDNLKIDVVDDADLTPKPEDTEEEAPDKPEDSAEAAPATATNGAPVAPRNT